jgi:hypothetical protein
MQRDVAMTTRKQRLEIYGEKDSFSPKMMATFVTKANKIRLNLNQFTENY